MYNQKHNFYFLGRLNRSTSKYRKSISYNPIGTHEEILGKFQNINIYYLNMFLKDLKQLKCYQILYTRFTARVMHEILFIFYILYL